MRCTEDGVGDPGPEFGGDGFGGALLDPNDSLGELVLPVGGIDGVPTCCDGWLPVGKNGTRKNSTANFEH